MIKYYKLFDLMNRKELKKTELLKIMSAPTLAKLNKGEVIKTDIIDKICEYLECQPGDIMEYVSSKTANEIVQDQIDLLKNGKGKNKFAESLKNGLALGNAMYDEAYKKK